MNSAQSMQVGERERERDFIRGRNTIVINQSIKYIYIYIYI